VIEPVIIGDARLLAGDVREVLRSLPAESVQCCITSPPYWGLRAYGTEPQDWPDGWRGELGQEPTPALFVEHLVEVFREVRRVLRPDGTLWLNMGDSYYGGKGQHGSSKARRTAKERGYHQSGGTVLMDTRPLDLPQEGLKPKDLCEIPSDVVRALRADGWWLRSRIPWLKRNAMPESTSDRPTQAVEYVFLLSPSGRYFYDGEAVRGACAAVSVQRADYGWDCDRPSAKGGSAGQHTPRMGERFVPSSGRARRNSDWWFESWQGLYTDDDGEPLAFIVNPAPFKGAHFATFPPKLVEPMVKVGTSEKGCCPRCGKPWERVVEANYERLGDIKPTEKANDPAQGNNFASRAYGRARKHSATIGWRPGCECGGEPIPCTVLDPFSGAGTTALVAVQQGRRAIGIELNAGYNRMAERRIAKALRPATSVDETTEGDLPLLAGKEKA